MRQVQPPNRSQAAIERYRLAVQKEDMMNDRRTSAGMSVTNLGPIEMVREGMTVMDSDGEKVGKVEGLKMGDPGAVTEAGNELQDTGLLGDVAEALFGDERE